MAKLTRKNHLALQCSNSLAAQRFGSIGGATPTGAMRNRNESGRRETVMELPPDVEYVEDANLFIWRPRGVLNEGLVNNIIVFLREQEDSFDRPFNRFTDLSALDAVDLNFDYIFHMALYRRLSYAGNKVKSAFYVSSWSAAHYAKLHALVTGRSRLQVSVFTDPVAAANWLGVPIKLLLANR
jgi:hypothetical protein